MKKITVLGAGLVGKAIAADLHSDFEVTAVDINQGALDLLRSWPGIAAIQANLRDAHEIRRAIQGADLVIGAMPGSMGFEAIKTVIDFGRNLVDISFFPEDPFLLDELARSRGVTAVVDCGVAPGLGNMILGHYARRMPVKKFECLVGGLPYVRRKPFEYKTPFSPADVIEEYTRPARYIENGHIVTRPALSDPELVEFPGVGTLEAFNTDGLRTLLKTVNIPNMREKTLRYPGHIELIQALLDAGFFSKTPRRFGAQEISPFEMTTKVLFDCWTASHDEREFTVMRISLDAEIASEMKKVVFDLFDAYDPVTKVSSMARTTGYTCTAVAHLVLDGRLTHPGIWAPEHVGETNGCLESVLSYLGERRITLQKSIV